MASLRYGLVTFPLKIREASKRSVLYRLSMPFVKETIRRVLVKEISPKEGLLEVEGYLKHLVRIPLLSRSFIVHLEDGEGFLLMEEVENISPGAMRFFAQVLNRRGFAKEKGIYFEKVPFLPYEVEVEGIGNIRFLEVLNKNLNLKTGLKVDNLKRETQPLCDRAEFYDDRAFIYIEFEAKDRSVVRDIIGITAEIANKYKIFFHLVPVIQKGKIRIRGVFQDDLYSSKHVIKDILEYFQRSFASKDPGVRVYMGINPVIAGAFELEHFRLPLVCGYVPELDKSKVVIDQKLKEFILGEGFIAFVNIPFVGRLREIEEFMHIFDTTPQENLPYLINITGIPGVGKTRFVDEVIEFISRKHQNIRILKIQFPYIEAGNLYTALSVIGQTLKVVSDKETSVSLTEIAKRIKRKLTDLSRKFRLLVVLDNADFIGDETLTFIKNVLSAKDSPPLFLILVSRNKKIPIGLSQEKYTHITLPPMSRESIKFVVMELLGAFPSSEFMEFIYDNTQGIPLYVVELLSRLKREERIVVKDGQVLLKKPPENLLSLEDILRNFYRSLSGTPVRVLLDIMAVFHGSIPLSILEAVFMDISRSDFDEAIKSLEETGLVELSHMDVFSAGITISFKNNLFKEVIRELLAPNWYGRLRNLIIDALKRDKRFPDIFKHRVIAEYLKEAGDFGYVDYMYRASREFMRVHAYDVAKDIMLKAQKYESYIKDKCDFYKTLTTVLIQTGDYVEAKKAYEKVMEYGEEKTNFRVLLGIIVYIGVGENKKAEKLLKELDLRKVRDPEKGYVYNALGVYYYRLGEYKKALKYMERARNFLRDNEAMFITNLSNMATTYERVGKITEALGVIDEAISIAKGIYHSQHLMGLYHNKAIIHIQTGEYEKAISALEESAFWAEKMSLNRAMSYIYNTRGVLLFELGRYKDALMDLNRAYEAVIKTEDKRQKSSILANLGYARTHLGEWKEALKDLKDSLSIRELLEDERGISYTLFYMGELARQREQYDEALNYFEKSMEIKKRINERTGILYVMAQKAFLLIEKKDFDTAYTLSRKGLKVAEEVSDRHAFFLLQLALAALYLSIGETKRAFLLLDEIRAELSHRNHHHLEGLAYYLSGSGKLQKGAYRSSFSDFLNAREKFLFTGEKKALAMTLEKLVEVMVKHSVYYMGSDNIIKEAREMVDFYRNNGLSNRADNLSLMLSNL